MQTYEYLAIPAPRKGVSSKGVKGVPGKFANAVTILMNEMAVEGWEYQRTDTLPCEERQGLTGKTVKYHAMLVFRRAVEQNDTDAPRLALPVPNEEETEAEEDTEIAEEKTSDDVRDETSDPSDDDSDDSGKEKQSDA